MANKTFKVKFEVDSQGAIQEVDKTLKSISDFENQLSSLQAKLKDTKIGTEEYKKLQTEIKRTEEGFKKAKDANKSWLDVVSEAPGLVGSLGQSLKGVKSLFSSLDMALKSTLIGFIAGLVVQLINKFKEMSGVMDPLLKITNIFSATMGKIATAILPPITAGIELLVKGVESLFNWFSKLTGSGDTLGDTLGSISESVNQLEDSQAAFELQQAKSNRTLQEAREIADDSTKSIGERMKALDVAGALERKIAKEERERQLQRARNLAAQMAAEMGFNETKVKALRNATAEQLEAWGKEIDGYKNLNREKSNELFGFIAKIEDSAAQEAKIGKKIDAQKEALRKEEEAKIKEAQQKALEARKNRINAEIELEKNGANTNEATLRKLLEQKDKLENQGTKKSKAELDLQKQNREKAVKDALQADIDETSKGEAKKLAVIKTSNELILKQKEVDAQKIKTLYGEDSDAFRKSQYDIQATREKALDDEIAFYKAKKNLTDEEITKLKELEIQRQALSNQRLELDKKILNQDLQNFIKRKTEIYDAEVLAARGNIALIAQANDEKNAAIKQYLDDLVAKEKITAEERKKIEEGLVSVISKGEKDILEARNKNISEYQKQIEFLNLKEKNIVKGTKAFYDNRIEIIKLSASLEKEQNTKKQEEEISFAKKTITDEEERNKKIGEIQAFYNEREIEIDKQTKTQRKQALYETINDATQIAQKSVEGLFTTLNAISEVREQKRLGALEKEKQRELEAAKGNAEEISKIEQEYSIKQESIKKQAFERNKKAQIAYTIIQTLLSAVQAFSSLAGIPIVGPALGAVAAAAALATGYANVAKIKATQYQSDSAPGSSQTAASTPTGVVARKAEGGIVNGPGTETSDSIPAMLSNGEFVVKASQTKKFRPMLEAINSGSLLPTFAIGGIVNQEGKNDIKSNAGLIEVLNEISKRPIQTYVTATEMSNQQQFDRTIKSRSLL